MTLTAYRFLLDEHMRPFEGLPLDLFGFDLVRLRDFNASYVNSATPDWLLYLAAAGSGFTGFITHDISQLEQEAEARAMEMTDLTIVTFKKGTDDELTKWGLLMAYAPRIVRKLDAKERGAFVLPAPGTPQTRKGAHFLSRIGRGEGVEPRLYAIEQRSSCGASLPIGRKMNSGLVAGRGSPTLPEHRYQAA